MKLARSILLTTTAAVSLLAACSITNHTGRDSVLTGATVDELREKFGNPSPDFARLLRKDDEGRDVVRVAVLTILPDNGRDFKSRDSDAASIATRALRSWLKGTGQSGLLPDAVETVDEQDDKRSGFIMDGKSTPFEEIRPKDRYRIKAPAGPGLGGGKAVAWDVQLFVGEPTKEALEAMRQASIVILNGGVLMRYEKLGDSGEYKLLMLNHCHSDQIEQTWLDGAARDGVDVQMITTSVRGFYGELAAFSGRMLINLIKGGKWADVIADLPGRGFRSAEVKGAADLKREENARIRKQCYAERRSVIIHGDGRVECGDVIPTPTPKPTPAATTVAPAVTPSPEPTESH